MSEMVERVARALWEVEHASYTTYPRWDELSSHVQHEQRRRAEAAIRAMREPGTAVIAAVEAKAEERYRAAPEMLRWYGEDVWAAGIDAALAKADPDTGRE